MGADWTQDFELRGAQRETALAVAHLALEGWHMVMPPGEPLVLDFGLRDFRHVGETEWWIVNDTANHYCGKFLFLLEDQRCPLHHHRAKHETFYIVRGTVQMETDGEARTMVAGDVLQVAPGVRHTFAAALGPALVLEVSLPSVPGDNVFEDERIGDHGVI